MKQLNQIGFRIGDISKSADDKETGSLGYGYVSMIVEARGGYKVLQNGERKILMMPELTCLMLQKKIRCLAQLSVEYSPLCIAGGRWMGIQKGDSLFVLMVLH